MFWSEILEPFTGSEKNSQFYEKIASFCFLSRKSQNIYTSRSLLDQVLEIRPYLNLKTFLKSQFEKYCKSMELIVLAGRAKKFHNALSEK